MRTFIAIELPKEIRESLSRLQARLKTTQADVKWVAPENIHLTLKFLGEIDEKKLAQISQILAETSAARKTFLARISSLGAFPKINSPRVIWVGIQQGDGEVKQIAKDLEEKITQLGIPAEERPFSSHITIGRTKSGFNQDVLVKDLKQLAENFTKEIPEFPVEKITLFKSTLTPKGPLYQALKESSLTTN